MAHYHTSEHTSDGLDLDNKTAIERGLRTQIETYKCLLSDLKDKLRESLAECRQYKELLEQEVEIEVPITDYDLDLFKDIIHNNNTAQWVFDDIHYNGRTVSITYMSEDELEQRSK